MLGIDPFDDNHGDVVFRDLIMLALAGFIVIVLILLPHINPVAEPADDVPAPGNVIVELSWPESVNADVDLWVQAPGDRPVGYSNQSGTIFNLLRDDLGHARDATHVNYESAYSRGIPSGEYVVNVHLYSNADGNFPLPVSVVVRVKTADDVRSRKIVETTLELTVIGEERTAVRFTLDEGKRLVAGSVHNIPKPLRNA